MIASKRELCRLLRLLDYLKYHSKVSVTAFSRPSGSRLAVLVLGGLVCGALEALFMMTVFRCGVSTGACAVSSSPCSLATWTGRPALILLVRSKHNSWGPSAVMNEQLQSVAVFTPQNMRRRYAKAFGTQQCNMRSALGRIVHIQDHSNTL